MLKHISPNQEYREDLRAHGECRDCEAPLLRSERNNSRCAVCRAKRNARNAEKRGYSPDGIAAAHERVRDAKQERVRLLGYDDGAGDRDAVQRRVA